jgi:hypothetical protein
MARRRKKNKKLDSAGFIFPTPLAAILLMVAILSLSYLWICSRCDALGKRIGVLEKEVVLVRERRFNEECKWAKMKTPRNIEAKLRRHGLVMTWPSQDRVVHIPYSVCRGMTGAPPAVEEHIRVAMND